MSWLDFLFGTKRIRELETELTQVRNKLSQVENALADANADARSLQNSFTRERKAREVAETTIKSFQTSLTNLGIALQERDRIITKLKETLAAQDLSELASLKYQVQTLGSENQTIEQEKAEAIRLLNEKEAQLNSPYSQDIPGILKRMLLAPSAQALSIPLRTRLRFELAKIAFVALAKQEIQWEEKDHTWILARLQEAFPTARIHPVKDGKYRILKDKASLGVILGESFAQLRTYVSELFDCDDFAFELSLHAKIWWLINSIFYSEDLVSMLHAYNVPLLSGEVLIVEPQNNLIMTLQEAEKAGYKTSEIYP